MSISKGIREEYKRANCVVKRSIKLETGRVSEECGKRALEKCFGRGKQY